MNRLARISNGLKKKIAIIGIGGRTGAMFGFELKEAADVLGVGKENDIKLIQGKKIYIKQEGNPPKLLEIKTIKDTEFPGQSLPDPIRGNSSNGPEIIFLTTKNPVGPAVEYYYSLFRNFSNSEIKTGGKIKTQEKLPVLILSQNGLAAGEDAKNALEKILGKRAKEVQIIRISLLNAVEKLTLQSKIYISYSLPLRLCFGVFEGPKPPLPIYNRCGGKETKEILRIFREAKIKAEEISPEQVRNMEFSKLFVNLIGVASASKEFSLEEGFKDKETFKEEILGLREYIKVVKAASGNFLNLSHYPIKLFASLIEKMPLPILVFFRKKIWQVINKGRGGREKGNLDEVDYYQGEVVKLGKKFGIKTPINEKILKRVHPVK